MYECQRKDEHRVYLDLAKEKEEEKKKYLCSLLSEKVTVIKCSHD